MKRRTQAAARGEMQHLRPMLLFPEVRSTQTEVIACQSAHFAVGRKQIVRAGDNNERGVPAAIQNRRLLSWCTCAAGCAYIRKGTLDVVMRLTHVVCHLKAVATSDVRCRVVCRLHGRASRPLVTSS